MTPAQRGAQRVWDDAVHNGYRRARTEAILRLLRAYADSVLELHDDDDDAELDAAIDGLTEAQARLRDMLARRAAPAKRVPLAARTEGKQT